MDITGFGTAKYKPSRLFRNHPKEFHHCFPLITHQYFGNIQGANLLYGLRKSKKFTQGWGAQLPVAYKKFWDEWKNQQPAAVHYVPKNGR